MKKILLTTNFSQKARNAADYAIRLLEEDHTRFLLLNAYELPFRPTELQISALQGGIGLSAKKGLIEDQHRFSKVTKKYGTSMATTATFGGVSRVIANYAQKQQVDFIVMGTKGRNYFKKIFSGCHTYEVFKKTNCSLMAVPEGATFSPPNKIIFIPDLNQVVSRPALQPLLDIAQKFQTKITVLHLVNQITVGATEKRTVELKKILGKYLDSFHLLANHQMEGGFDQLFADCQPPDLFVLRGSPSFMGNLFRFWSSQRSPAFSQKPLLALRHVPVEKANQTKFAITSIASKLEPSLN